jgi:hypothetical protein
MLSLGRSTVPGGVTGWPAPTYHQRMTPFMDGGEVRRRVRRGEPRCAAKVGSSGPVGASRRVGSVARTALVGFALVLATTSLTSCVRYPPPVRVPFPDDPRVLHGAWEARTEGLFDVVHRAVLGSGGDTLLLWSYGHAWRYEHGAPDTWIAQPFANADDLRAAAHDPVIDALVGVSVDGNVVEARAIAVANGSATVVQVDVPAGEDVTDTAVGSGRVFALTRDDSGTRRLRWWNAMTGADAGAVIVPNFRDGVRVSANGRTLSFWDLSSAIVRVVDTADPTALRAIQLGLCRSNYLGEASEDGRWFAYADCLDRVFLVDLTRIQDGSRATGVKVAGPTMFARGSSELVWRSADGPVRAYDPTSGTITTVLDVGQLEDPEFDVWNDTLVLDRTHGRLVAGVAGGRVRVADLATPGSAVDLPELAVAKVSMILEATNLGAVLPAGTGPSDYEFHGTADVTGVPYEVRGQVVADRLHEYVPDPALTTQALPPPTLWGWATLAPSPGGDPAFELSFWTNDAAATVYRGRLDDVAGGISYTVRLERVSP